MGMKRILLLILLVAVAAFSEEPVVNPSPAAPVNDSVAAVETVREELAMRDSVMEVRDSLCSMEKDSLRSAIVVEQAKSENWEKSYNTVREENEKIRKDNEVCAQALGVALDVSEKDKEEQAKERKSAAMMSSTSFLGGVVLGGLLFWLIFE